jgi:hypothetical protein
MMITIQNFIDTNELQRCNNMAVLTPELADQIQDIEGVLYEVPGAWYHGRYELERIVQRFRIAIRLGNIVYVERDSYIEPLTDGLPYLSNPATCTTAEPHPATIAKYIDLIRSGVAKRARKTW